MFYHIHQTIYFESTLTLQDVGGGRYASYHFFSLFYSISQKVRIFGQKWVPLGENQVTLCQS